MFRKLQDLAAAVASAVFGTPSNRTTAENHIQQLQSLGNFTRAHVLEALEAASGNADRAAELLRLQHQRQPQPYIVHIEQHNMEDEDRQSQQALQESLQGVVRPKRPPATASSSPKTTTKKNTATSKSSSTSRPISRKESAKFPPPSKSSTVLKIRAHTKALQQHHPCVKIPPKLQEKSTEAQIKITTGRMMKHPAAVDALHSALTKLRSAPRNDKYRRINARSEEYRRSDGTPTPGTKDFLLALKFTVVAGYFILHLYDQALIDSGIAALKQTMATRDYLAAKEQLLFTKEMKKLLDEPISPAESAARRVHAARCPIEAVVGSGSGIPVELQLPSGTRTRRFHTDDTIEAVLEWIGATAGTAILKHILDGTWVLINDKDPKQTPIDVTIRDITTLHTARFSPSARLKIRLS